MGEDFPRSARLLNGRDFKRVFDHRKTSGNSLFRIHYAPSETARLGVAVSKRVSPKAVVRHRIRRQVRESFRIKRDELAGCDYIVMARPAAAQATPAELRMALNQLWQRFT
jgi:ribonuclease P protein component